MTEKAVRITIETIDGDYFSSIDTTWLPRSICQDLKVVTVTEDDGGKRYDVSATVPAWWVRKLDTRTSWEKRGMTRPPMATRPY
ncbi:MAG TPA: hypothetical protein VG734_26050 [Lacunisphaera sp.]|nr:hypothetical protein [Lacunisphaera sp.]